MLLCQEFEEDKEIAATDGSDSSSSAGGSLARGESSLEAAQSLAVHSSAGDKRDASSSNSSGGGAKKGIVVEETKGTGAISWSVYWYYLTSCGGVLFGPSMVLVLVWSAASWYMTFIMELEIAIS